MHRGGMRAKQAIRLLLDEGAQFVRKKGSHHYYRFAPDGALICIPCGGRQSTMSDGAIRRVYNEIRRHREGTRGEVESQA